MDVLFSVLGMASVIAYHTPVDRHAPHAPLSNALSYPYLTPYLTPI